MREQDKNEIIELYNQGYSVHAIAYDWHTTKNNIVAVLVESGVELRAGAAALYKEMRNE
jgi:hypothetical protein